MSASYWRQYCVPLRCTDQPRLVAQLEITELLLTAPFPSINLFKIEVYLICMCWLTLC